MKQLTLRRINNVLGVIVVLLSLYLLLSPFAPKVTFELKDPPKIASQGDPAAPKDNTLIIPAMKLRTTVHEGQDVSTLNKGVWHRPLSSTPENGGNTVLTGHRFTYGGPSVLYDLDRVRVGDDIFLYWEGKKYNYQVRDVIVVSPHAKEIEEQTTEPLLTIYSCTPLITASKRLVIQAVPIGEQE